MIHTRPVLVTGATGFIGRYLLRELASAAVPTRILSRSGNPAESQAGHSVTVVQGDICNEAALQTALAGCSMLINLAGIAHVDSSDREALYRVNQEAPLRMFRLGQTLGVERMVQVSSTLAADVEAGRDNSAYARSKLAAEQELSAIAKNSQLELTIIRPANVYGPGMRGNLAGMIRRIRNGRMPRLPRTGASLSMIAVTDLAKVLLMAAETPAAAGKTYTLTDGVEYRLSEMEEAIYRETGRERPVWPIPRVVLYAALCVAPLLQKAGLIDAGLNRRTYRNLVSNRIYSNAAAREELEFTPSTDFYRELPQILKAMEQQGVTNPT
ncbi:MAG: SDR family NAD(P)-dependent oxidoreductase [Gammaproteobacteria bacterium]